MNYDKCRIGYVVANLKRVGPTNQTLNIIRYSGAIDNCVVITLFDEPEDTQIQEYYQHGIKVLCLHLSHKSILFKGVSLLAEALRNENVQLVHSYGTFPDTIATHACRKVNIEHIITLRNFPMEDMTTRMNRCLGTIGAVVVLHYLKRCKNVICCSKSIETKMKETYHWNNLYSIQNGVDVTKFAPCDKKQVRRELGVDERKLVFISTGSMIPRKRIDETVDAFIAGKPSESAELWLLGDGILLEELKAKYAAEKNVKFLGKQSQVARYLSAADVFVSSSESEGMPNSVLEAIACGLPVYLSDIPQHLEVFDNVSGCGVTYPLGKTDMLTALIKDTVPERVQNMRNKTAKLLTSNLTMESMGKDYASLYRRVMMQ